MNVDHEITLLKDEIRRLGTPSKLIIIFHSLRGFCDAITLDKTPQQTDTK